MTMPQIHVEFGVDDETDEIEEKKIDKRVDGLKKIAVSLGIDPRSLARRGAAQVARMATVHYGQIVTPESIESILAEPEFNPDA